MFVFVFFGLVATLGTTYTQAGQLSLAAIIGAIGTGLIACALLMANNVRDIPTDIQAGKKTLAVRLGDKHARESYVLMLAVAILLVMVLAPGRPWMLIVLLLIPASLMPSWLMINGRKRKSLIPVLKQTGPDQPRLQRAVLPGPGAEPRAVGTSRAFRCVGCGGRAERALAPGLAGRLRRPCGEFLRLSGELPFGASGASVRGTSERTVMSGLASTRGSSASASSTSPAVRSGLALPENRSCRLAVAASRCFWKNR